MLRKTKMLEFYFHCPENIYRLLLICYVFFTIICYVLINQGITASATLGVPDDRDVQPSVQPT